MADERTPRWFLDDIISKACKNDKAIINAFDAVPRAFFVDSAMRTQAYTDKALPIGLGQTISQPSTVAHMLSLLELRPTDTVLEIGSGSGFVTALLSKIVSTVYALERLPELMERSRTTLRKLNITNAKFKVSDGAYGWSEFAPYDKVIASAGAKSLPEKLFEELNEGGVLIIPINGKLMRYRKVNGEKIAEEGVSVVFVDFVGS